jgi:hypothetical protein
MPSDPAGLFADYSRDALFDGTVDLYSFLDMAVLSVKVFRYSLSAYYVEPLPYQASTRFSICGDEQADADEYSHGAEQHQT